MKLIEKIVSELSDMDKKSIIALCTALIMINYEWNSDLDWKGLIESAKQKNKGRACPMPQQEKQL